MFENKTEKDKRNSPVTDAVIQDVFMGGILKTHTRVNATKKNSLDRIGDFLANSVGDMLGTPGYSKAKRFYQSIVGFSLARDEYNFGHTAGEKEFYKTFSHKDTTSLITDLSQKSHKDRVDIALYRLGSLVQNMHDNGKDISVARFYAISHIVEKKFTV